MAGQGRNRRVVLILACVALAMGGLSWASVPLYRLFCQVTGFGGTPQTAEAAAGPVLERRIEIRFNADVADGLDWRVDAAPTVSVPVGAETLAHYRARNTGGAPVTGSATFNVTPLKAGPYFSKVECFCFTEQRLAAGEALDMPVSFFVDPAIAEDRGMDDVDTITLSYTFFEVREDAPNREQTNGG